MKNFLKDLRERVMIYDGSKGYMLQKLGLKGGECPELWNVVHSSEVRSIYKAYKEAGSDIIQTNTFQGNRPKLEEYGLGDRTYELNYESVRLAKEVMGKDGYVAASIGPIGKLFEPSGELTFDAAYEIYKEQVKAVADAGADIINFETFTDLAELRAALLAAKETAELPVICSLAFEANGKTLMGTDPYTAAVVLNALGADMIGSNCSFGPEHLLEIIKKMAQAGGVYLSAKPNAGLPEYIEGRTVYTETPERFAELSKEFVQYGVRLMGGCCGTTPEFIREVSRKVKGIEPAKTRGKLEQIITSGTKTLNLEESSDLSIGYLDARVNQEMFSELSNGNMEYIIDKSLEIAAEGYDAIYIHADNINGSVDMLAGVVNTAQGYIREPFILDTQNPEELGKALRLYKGKAGIVINGVGGAVLEDLLKVAKKYGSTIIDKQKLPK